MNSTVNATNQLKKSLFMEYNLLYKKKLSFAAAGLQKNSKLFNNRPGETLTQTILYLEPHDYQINFINIDSCHQKIMWNFGGQFADDFPV